MLVNGSEQKGLVETRSFDPAGKLIEEAMTTPDGSLLYRTLYKYDSGIKTAKEVYDPKGQLRERQVYVSDRTGQVTEALQYRGNDVLSGRSTYKHDGSGDVVEWTLYNARGAIVDRWTYTYDERGKRVEEIRYYADGSIDAHYRCSFDDHGNAVERIKNRADATLVEKQLYTCEYDSTGNWVKKTTSTLTPGDVEAIPAEVARRSITYW